jgi:hypothetical protein
LITVTLLAGQRDISSAQLTWQWYSQVPGLSLSISNVSVAVPNKSTWSTTTPAARKVLPCLASINGTSRTRPIESKRSEIKTAQRKPKQLTSIVLAAAHPCSTQATYVRHFRTTPFGEVANMHGYLSTGLCVLRDHCWQSGWFRWLEAGYSKR